MQEQLDRTLGAFALVTIAPIASMLSPYRPFLPMAAECSSSDATVTRDMSEGREHPSKATLCSGGVDHSIDSKTMG